MAQDTGAASVAATESAQRQMAAREAAQKVQEARLAYTAGRYGDAVELYRAALEVMPVVPATAKQVKFIKDSLADALVANAMDYRKVGRLDEAVEFLQEAQEISPGHKYAAAELEKTQDPARTNPALTPQHVGNVHEVKRLLSLAFGYYDLGNYDKAMQTFESVLRIDPYNTAARRGMEMVSKRKTSYIKTAHDSFRAKALADVDAAWEEHAPLDENTPGTAGADVSAEQSADAVAVEDSIAAALKEMVIPKISFEEATIMEVQEVLLGQIARFEAAGIKADRAINVMYDFGPADSPMCKAVMDRRATLVLEKVSVLDLLNMIDRQFGISHYISSLGVEFILSGKDYGPMVERVYTVPPHFFDVAVDEPEEDEDDFVSARRPSVMVKRVNPVVALKEMGISFPEGANARYNSSTRQLTVRNTLFNQEEIAELVSTPLVSERAVSLNIIAMEVAENDLNELGFEWLFNSSLDPNHMFLSGAKQVVTGLPDVWAEVGAGEGLSATEKLRSGNLVISSDNIENLIRNGSAQGYGINNAYRLKAPGIFGFRGVWKTADVTMIMRGASQKKGTDIMANPRIVFTPGREEQVVFANVSEMFYPESYAAPQIPTTQRGEGAVAAPAHPETFVRFGMVDDAVGGIGTVVQVHEADVAADGQHVTLALTVTQNEFDGFVNWGSPIHSAMKVDNDLVSGLQVEKFVLTQNNILQPIFKRRMENTKITVGSGSVVVLGGLKESRAVRYEDKLPVLGDLPLVGRLFRSEGVEKIRKAYMVFVKVDVVDPTGRKAGSGETVQDFTD